MKIALITHSFFPYSVGGREKHVYGLAKTLAKKGHDVEIFTCSDSLWSGYTKKESEKLRIHYFPTFRLKFSTGYYRIPVGMFLSLSTKKFDVLHAHEYFHFTTCISALVSKLKRDTFILTEHGFPEQVGVLKIVLRTYDKIVLPFIVSNCSRIIAVSNFIKDEVVSKYEVSEDKARVVYNGIILEDYKTDEEAEAGFLERYNLKNKMIVLSVGRLVREKGFQHVIRAMPKIKKEIPDAIFVAVGPDVYCKKELMDLAKSLDIKQDVIFTGPVSEKIVNDAVASSDIVVIPSTYEPFGIVALEAMAYGKPIVASSTGGLKEFLNNKNSILVEPANESALAKAVIHALKNKELAKRIGEKAKKDVKKFELNNIANRLLEIYNESKIV